jgi:hypothetical protein
MRAQFQELLEKEMGRRDFLKYAGSVLLTMIGVTGFLRAISQGHEFHTSGKGLGHGYGSTAYGGNKSLN